MPRIQCGCVHHKGGNGHGRCPGRACGEGEVRSKPRDTDAEESSRGACEKVRGNGQGVTGKQQMTLMEPANQSQPSRSEHQTITLGFWVIKAAGREATSVHRYPFSHSSPETLNSLHAEKLHIIPRGEKEELTVKWQGDSREGCVTHLPR